MHSLTHSRTLADHTYTAHTLSFSRVKDAQCSCRHNRRLSRATAITRKLASLPPSSLLLLPLVEEKEDYILHTHLPTYYTSASSLSTRCIFPPLLRRSHRGAEPVLSRSVPPPPPPATSQQRSGDSLRALARKYVMCIYIYMYAQAKTPR